MNLSIHINKRYNITLQIKYIFKVKIYIYIFKKRKAERKFQFH